MSLWKQVFDRLPETEQKMLALSENEHHVVLDVVLQATLAQRDIVEKEKSTFMYRGRSILLTDITDRAISWIQRFVQVGDMVVQYDPVHFALPWAGVRFLLQVCFFLHPVVTLDVDYVWARLL